MHWLPEPPVRWLAAAVVALTFQAAFAQEAPTTPSDVIVDMDAVESPTAAAIPSPPLPLETPPAATPLPSEIAEPTRASDLLPPPLSAFQAPGQPPEPGNQAVPLPLPETTPEPQSFLDTAPQVAQAEGGNVSQPEVIEEVPVTPPEAEPDAEAAVDGLKEESPDSSEEIPANQETSQEPSETSVEQQETQGQPAEDPVELDPNAPAAPVAEGGARIAFPPEEKGIPTEAYSVLDEIAGRMLADSILRLQIECFAAGEKESEGKARRLSLVRCLAIRQYFIEKDIRSTRMDIRALGFRSNGQPVDRVDILPAPEGQ